MLNNILDYGETITFFNSAAFCGSHYVARITTDPRGDKDYGMQSWVPEAVNANCNKWGSNHVGVIPAKISSPVIWFLFWATDEGPSLQKLFEMKTQQPRLDQQFLKLLHYNNELPKPHRPKPYPAREAFVIYAVRGKQAN